MNLQYDSNNDSDTDSELEYQILKKQLQKSKKETVKEPLKPVTEKQETIVAKTPKQLLKEEKEQLTPLDEEIRKMLAEFCKEMGMIIMI